MLDQFGIDNIPLGLLKTSFLANVTKKNMEEDFYMSWIIARYTTCLLFGVLSYRSLCLNSIIFYWSFLATFIYPFLCTGCKLP